MNIFTSLSVHLRREFVIAAHHVLMCVHKMLSFVPAMHKKIPCKNSQFQCSLLVYKCMLCVCVCARVCACVYFMAVSVGNDIHCRYSGL